MSMRIVALIGLVLSSSLVSVPPVNAASAAAPDTVITKGPSGDLASTTAAFAFKAKPKRDATAQCRLDAGRWKKCSSPVTYQGLGQGSHRFAVRAKRGGLKDKSPATRTFRVDTVGPALSIAGVGARTSDATPTFVLAASEKSTLTCRLGEATPTSCTSPFTLPGPLAEGSYALTVQGRDLAGNLGQPATRTFDVVNPVPRTGATMEAAVEMWGLDTISFDVPADCADSVRIDCPDGVHPIPAVDQIHVDSVHTLAVEPNNPARYRLTMTSNVTTASGKPVKLTFPSPYGFVTCDLTLDSARGAVNGWTPIANVDFVDIDGETAVDFVGAAASGAEQDDVVVTGDSSCQTIFESMPPDVGFLEQQVASAIAAQVDDVGDPLCAALGPDFLGRCP